MKKLFVALCGTLALGTSTAREADINTELLNDYARYAQYLDIAISPAGTYLAATSRGEGGTVQITVLDINNNKILSVMKGRGKESVASFNWVNDERLILKMAREFGPLEQPALTGEIFAMDADGSRQKVLTGPRSDSGEYVFADVVDFLPDDPDSIMIYQRSFMSKEPFLDLYAMKVTTGRKRSVGRVPLRAYEGSNVNVVVDKNGVSRVVVGSDPEDIERTLILARDGANQDWYPVVNYANDDGGFIPLFMGQSETQVIGLSNGDTDTRVLSILDLTTKQESVIAEHPETDLVPIVSPRKELLGALYEYENLEQVMFDDVKDAEYARVLQGLFSAFPNRRVAITSSTKDREKMVVRVGSVNHPTQFYIFEPKNNKLTPLVNAQPWFQGHQLPMTENITYETRDGLEVHALLTLPNDQEAKKLPLILLPHGGPHGVRDSLANIDSDAKVFAEHGYAVLQPNYRGSGGFGKAFLEAGYRNWGTTMINDMTDGVDHLIREGVVDPERVCVYGASYGGYAALQSGVREPEKYKCIVGFVGVYDLGLMFEEGDIPQRQSGINYLNKVLPADDAARKAQSPLYNVEKLKAPVFIIQGGADVRVPETHAFRLRDALEKRDHPYEWMYKEFEGHGFYVPENNVERWTKMLTFFDRYIGQ